MGQSGCGIMVSMKNRGLGTPGIAWTEVNPSNSYWTLFQTSLGWTAIERCHRGVLRVLIGDRTRFELLSRCPAGCTIKNDTDNVLVDRIREYFEGSFDNFEDVPIAAQWNTPFQYSVIRALRQVGYGETTTYAELARRAGRPGAARAVGQVMANNPVPLLVPCHRVLGSGGALGGFSAPTGVVLKQRLLDLEKKRPRDGNPWAP